jgi:glutaredoxin
MIKIFSTPKCAECIRLKDFLDKKRVFYQEIDMTKVGVKEQQKLKVLSVPTIEFNGKRISVKELKEMYE